MYLSILNGHLDCFQFEAIVNTAEMNILVPFFDEHAKKYAFLLHIYVGVEWLGHSLGYMFCFNKYC